MTSTIRNLPSMVDRGRTTTFEYIKWSDGTSECWGKIGISSTTNGVYSGNFPNGLFVDIPTVSITNWYGKQTDENRGARSFIVSDGSNATQLIAYFRKSDGTNYTGYFGITVHAVGRWE